MTPSAAAKQHLWHRQYAQALTVLQGHDDDEAQILRAQAEIGHHRFDRAEEALRGVEPDPGEAPALWLAHRNALTRILLRRSTIDALLAADSGCILGDRYVAEGQAHEETKYHLAELYTHVASVRRRQRCQRLAEAAITQAHALVGDVALVDLARGRLAVTFDDRPAARLAFDRAARGSGPAAYDAKLEMISLLLALGEFERATEWLTSLRPFAAHDHAARNLAVRLALTTQAWGEVIAAIDDMLAHGPDGGWRRAAAYERARALHRLGRGDEARAALVGIGAGDDPLAARARRLTAVLDHGSPRAARLRAFPTVAQLRDHCGPASCELYLRYFGIDADQLEIARRIKVPDSGTPIYRMRRFLEQSGFVVRRLEANLDRLKTLLDLGLPVILEEEYSDSLHVAVAIGYDDGLGVLEVQDPMSHKVRETDYDALEKLRALSNHGALVGVPRNDAERLAALDAAGIGDCEYMVLVDQANALLDEGDAAGADALVDRSLALHREYEMSWLYRFRRASQQSESDPAAKARLREVAETAASIWPDDEWPQQLLGRAAREEDRTEDALRHFELARDRDPGDAQNWAMIARLEQRLGRPGAAQAADEALERDPSHGDALLCLAQIAEDAGDVQACTLLTQAVVELHPDLAGPRGILLRALLQRDDLTEARALVDGTPPALLEDGFFAVMVSRLLSAEERDDEAIAVLRAAERKEGQPAPDLELAERLLERDELVEALSLSLPWAQREEPHPIALLLVGRALVLDQQHEAALPFLQRAALALPDFPPAHEWLARAEQWGGNASRGLRQAMAAVGASGGAPRYRALLGELWLAVNRFADAYPLLLEAASQAPFSYRLLSALTRTSKGGDPEAVAAIFNTQIEHSREHPDVLAAIVDHHLREGREEAAKEVLGDLARVAPEHPLCRVDAIAATLDAPASQEQLEQSFAEMHRILLRCRLHIYPISKYVPALLNAGLYEEAKRYITQCGFRWPHVMHRIWAQLGCDQHDMATGSLAFMRMEAEPWMLAQANYEIALHEGDFEAAEKVAHEASALWGHRPDDGVVEQWELCMFDCRLQRGDVGGAISLGDHIAHAPDEIAKLAMRALVFDQPAVAMHFAPRVIGDGDTALLVQARLAELHGDVPRATELFRRGAQLHPTWEMFHAGLARLALQAGDAAAARHHVDRAFAIDPWTTEVLTIAGFVCVAENKNAEAMVLLDRAWNQLKLHARRRGHHDTWAVLATLEGNREEADRHLGLLPTQALSVAAQNTVRWLVERAWSQGRVPRPELWKPPAREHQLTAPKLEPLEHPKLESGTSLPMLTPEQCFGLALGGVLNAMNQSTHFILGGEALTALERGQTQGLLMRDWSIVEGTSAKETLAWLENEGHRHEYDLVLKSLHGGPRPDDVNDYDRKAAYLRTHHASLGAGGILAWDLGRIVNVAGWCAVARYLTEEQAWDHILRAAHQARATFSSWQHYGTSYLHGLAYWRSPAEGAKLARYQSLFSAPSSPWVRVNWG